MKLFAIYITNNATAYGGVQPLRQVVLFVWLGNPIVYKGNTFTWEQGRKLAGGTLNGNSFQYSYDGNGMRYKKLVNGTTTEYYWNGTQLLAEYNRTTKEMKYYFYDQTGIAGMIYNGSYYYFDKNTLGDVIAIRDAYGDVIAKYKYDAWGNVLQETNLYNSGMASKNPFRYRGYYYDSETGFYYLQTRYYDPEIGRFINADDYELVGTLASVPGQLNMYAYCGNNPVMYTDPTGQAWWHWVVGAALVVVAAIAVLATAGGVAAGVGAVATVLAGGSASTLGATVAASAFIGASTTYIAMGIAAGISSLGTDSFIDNFSNYGETAMWSTLGAGVLSGVSGYFSHISYGTHTPSSLYPLGKYYNVNGQTMTHYGLNGKMWWSKHFTDHKNASSHPYVPHYHAELPHYPHSGFANKGELILELILRAFGRGHS